MNNNITNPELLKAFLEPMVNELVDERVKQELEKKLASINARNEPERPILIDEAAEMLGYSRSHMYTLCREKKIPHVKKGRWLYFYVSKLNEWLEEGKMV
jgi:excisionase family DNA binding protein